jgi:hypothetical protein
VICSKERPFASNENWLRKVWFGRKEALILVTPRTVIGFPVVLDLDFTGEGSGRTKTVEQRSSCSDLSHGG